MAEPRGVRYGTLSDGSVLCLVLVLLAEAAKVASRYAGLKEELPGADRAATA